MEIADSEGMYSVHLMNLERTNIPTVLIEGKDDTFVYARLLANTKYNPANLYPCGGRGMLLKLFKKIKQEPQKYPLVKLFVADKDMYIFTSVPQSEEEICFTEGYSIENDLYIDAQMALDKAFLVEILEKKTLLFENVCHWFAFEVTDYLKNWEQGIIKDTKFSKCNLSREDYFDRKQLKFTEEFLYLRQYYPPSQEIEADLQANYTRKLRGHTLFQCLWILFFIRKNMPNYSTEQLIEICLGYAFLQENSHINRIKNAIEVALDRES